MPIITFNTDCFKCTKAEKLLGQKGYKLYNYQKKGLLWLLNKERKGTGGILADDMGLGKTIQMISLMLGNTMKTTLLVVPASLVNQWCSEIKKFSDIHIEKDGIDIKKIEENESSIVITSYNKLKHIIGMKLKIDRIICDEAHYFRNYKSVTFKLLEKIRTPYRWAITGTPIQNYLSDIKTLFKFVDVDNNELEYNIEHYLLRRVQKEVDLKLPPIKLSISFINIKNDDETYYDKVSDSYIPHLEKSLRLRQVCVAPNSVKKVLKKNHDINYDDKTLKFIKLNSIIRALNKNKDTEKPIIFTYFRAEIEYLYNKLHHKYNYKVGVIHGSVPQEERSEIIADKSYEILLVQINAGGTGLNLQHFDTIYFTSPQWNPSIEAQAIARVNRIGQKNRVKVKRFIMGNIAKHTIEKRILEIQRNKKKLINGYINSH
jgi:SNF2 family DNA or RNA helicase